MTQKTETNKKYKELKKSIEDAGYHVDEKGDFVAVIHDGLCYMGVVSHRESVEVIADTEIYSTAKIAHIVNDAGIPLMRDGNLYVRVTDTRIKNLRDEVASLREKLSQKITV